MSQDQTAVLLDALRQRIEDLNRLSTELHLYGGTEHEPDVWRRLHHVSSRACEVAEFGLRAGYHSGESSSPSCRCSADPGPDGPVGP